MTSRRDDLGDLFHPDNAMDEVFARANPNPERKDCPSDEVLRELANKQRPITDRAYEHLAQCSPCYRTFRQFQQERRSSANRPQAGYRRWLAAAAALVLAAASVWFLIWGRGSGMVGNSGEVRAQMDLRKYAVERSDTEGPTEQPLSAQRARLDLTLLLPVGSEAGSYELQVMDSELHSQRSAIGEAQVANYVTTLHTRVDLRSLAPGDYKLALRRKGEDWRLFPLRLE